MTPSPMKFLAVIVASALSALGALAPDSIGGRVLQYSLNSIVNRTSYAETVILGTDGKFTTLYSGGGTAFVSGAPAYAVFIDTQADGTYTYTRVDDARGTLVLNRNDGTTETLDLPFTTPTSGGTPPVVSISFSLIDPVVLANAPSINISLRGNADATHPLIAGFVVPERLALPVVGNFMPGALQREVLIRVVGPSLAQFGVTGVWADPDFKLYRGSAEFSDAQVHYADWGASPVLFRAPAEPSVKTERSFQKLFTYAGAFPLLLGSKDAVQFARLDPGNYTIVAAPAAGDAGGTALIEVYFLP